MPKLAAERARLPLRALVAAFLPVPLPRQEPPQERERLPRPALLVPGAAVRSARRPLTAPTQERRLLQLSARREPKMALLPVQERQQRRALVPALPEQERRRLPALVPTPLPEQVRLRQAAAARKPALPQEQAPSRLRARPAFRRLPRVQTAAHLALLRSR